MSASEGSGQPAGRQPAPTNDTRPPRLLEIPDAAAPGFELVARGDHVGTRAEADRLLAAGGEEETRAGGLLRDAVRPDPWALRTAALVIAGFLVVGWLALVPHSTVRAARGLLGAVEASQEAEARAWFSEEGWRGGGSRLFREFSGQRGRAYERSRRAREVGFVMISFARPSGASHIPRRYLLFEPDSGAIRAVRSARPRPPKPQ